MRCNQHNVSVVTQGKKEINRSTLQIMTNVSRSDLFNSPRHPGLKYVGNYQVIFYKPTHTHIHRHTNKKKEQTKMLEAGGDKTEQKHD